MTESVSYLGLGTSLFLPWVLGSIWCFWLLRKSGRYNLALVLGQGYLLGILATTLFLYLWGFFGLPFQFWWLAAGLLLLCIAGVIALKKQTLESRPQREIATVPVWQLLTASILIMLILARYLTILQEMAFRPLFAWDAWMNWAPKAIVWFHLGEFTEFVSPRDWLTNPEKVDAYTLGATGVWRFPVVIPLIQLWGMLGAGVAKHSLIYGPWFLVVITMGLSLYGYLRLAGHSFLVAVTACYLLLNLPYLNVHTALTGYADIWVMAAFGCATFALQEWERHRESSQAIIALLIAALCSQMKIPGLIFGGIIALSFTLLALNAFQRKRVIILCIITAVGVGILAYGVEVSLGEIGNLKLSLSRFTIPYIGSFSFNYHPVHDAVLTTLYLMFNWHLLWYLFAGAIMYSILRRQFLNLPIALLTNLGVALLFILFVYYFTGRYKFAEDYTQINRALIYLSPLIVMFLFQSSLTGGRPASPTTGNQSSRYRPI
jgi:hypothetical protein